MRALALLISVISLLAAEKAEEPKVAHRLPALASVFPQGSQPGKNLRVAIIGDYLDRAGRVIFTGPGITARVIDGSFTRMTLEFEVAETAAYGPHYFRVISPRGASNLLQFRVGDQPHVLEAEPNASPAQAQEIALPATINARLERDGDFDFYKFQVQAGDTWVFDLRSARNGNSLDAALFLMDAEGRRIVYDEDHFIWDPFLVHTFDAAGTYIAGVQPTHRSNDPTFAYQLDIRRSAHLDTVAPLALRPGATAEVTVFGAALLDKDARLEFDQPGFSGRLKEVRGRSALAEISVPASARDGVYSLTVHGVGGRSNPVKFQVDSLPRFAGGDLIPPVAVTGVAKYREPERFWFGAQAGDAFVFEVRARRLGSPVDSILRLLDSSGKAVATNDDAQFPSVEFNKDSRLAHTFKEAGRYQIEMRNLTATTGEDFPYQLVMTRAEPRVELALKNDRGHVYPDETSDFDVTLARVDGHKGPVPLAVQGLPEGVTAEAKDDGSVKLTASAEAKPGTYGLLKIASPAAANPAWRSVRISSGGGEGATFAPVFEAPIVVAEKPLFSLEPQANTVNLVRGSSVEIPLSITYAKEFAGEIRFAFEWLPEGVRCEPVSVKKGENTIKVRLEAADTAKAGRFARLAILGTSPDGRIEQAPRIALVVN